MIVQVYAYPVEAIESNGHSVSTSSLVRLGIQMIEEEVKGHLAAYTPSVKHSLAPEIGNLTLREQE